MVGLITPCGFLEQDGIDKSVRNLEDLGFKVKLGRHVLARRGRYAGTVAQRLEDLHSMFADPQVNARNMIIEVNDPVIGKVKTSGNPVKVVGAIDETSLRSSPELDADRAAILAEFMGASK